MSPLEIRDATEEDLGGILDILNVEIATSTSVYTDEPATLDERRTWYEWRLREGFPVLVAMQGDAVVGFASYRRFRPFDGYRFSVEHSLYVRGDERGRGIGRALLEALIARASADGHHTMVAGVDGENEGSIRFHESLGFVEQGRLIETGYKFGRFLDLVFLVKRL